MPTDLKNYTSWLVGGPADHFFLPTTVDELVAAQKFATDKNLPVTIFGGGSNILISDYGIRGVTICLKKFSSLQVHFSENEKKIVLQALAGTPKSELLKTFLKYRLAPALFLAGLPGDVGGGIVMNAGVSENYIPREFGEIVDWVEVLRPDFQIHRIDSSDLQWTYRHSQGWQPGIILRAQLSWQNQPVDSILDQVKQANKNRLLKQPLDMPSCGSVFVNPPDKKAAQLIDSCGLKGYTLGGAQVSLKHANFIVNIGDATAQDIWSVIVHVRETVRKKTGVDLKTEVVRLGEWK